LVVILFDRDGTLNVEPQTPNKYITELSQFKLYPDVFEFFSRNLRESRFSRMAVVTNQQCVGKGLATKESIEEMHMKIVEASGLDRKNFPLFACTHLENTCFCRKPLPGLLLEAMSYFSCQPKDMIFVGDSDSDLLASTGAEVPFVRICRKLDVESCDGSFIRSLLDLFHNRYLS
jgi:D-glycero-D-manno-heptose 1,7-bisphosphate phosphatase